MEMLVRICKAKHGIDARDIRKSIIWIVTNSKGNMCTKREDRNFQQKQIN